MNRCPARYLILLGSGRGTFHSKEKAMAGHRSDMMKLIRRAEKQGCISERLANGHWKITTPSGVVIRTSFSPSNPGAYRVTLRDLRKAGVEL